MNVYTCKEVGYGLGGAKLSFQIFWQEDHEATHYRYFTADTKTSDHVDFVFQKCQN